MQQLSGLDAAFLTLETPTSSGHIGGICLLDPRGAPRKLTIDSLRDLFARRLPQVPVLRRRLQSVPLGLDQPYWVDDESFDLEFHVREIALPRPGSEAQLTEQVSRLHSRSLDHSRPLWECYLITGLSGGRAAVFTKVHHAAIDGVSGAELMTLLLDLSPDGRGDEPVVPFVPKRAPSSLRLLGSAAVSLATRPIEMVRMTRGLVRAVPVVGSMVAPLLGLPSGRGSDGGVMTGASLMPPPTPFNRPVTAHRRLAVRSVDLDDVKRVKNAFGVSVNDVVMAMSAGALRRWLIDHDALPEAPLVAMVPVSVRDTDQQSALGNKVSAMFASLPTNLPSVVGRLRSANTATMVAKAQHAAIPQGLVEDITEFAPPALFGRAARVAFATGLIRRLPFNLVISNVPGPNVQVYLAGAKLLAYYPVSVVLDGQGLNITVQSYRGQMCFGVVACRELVPDVELIGGYLVDELDRMLDAIGDIARAERL